MKQRLLRGHAPQKRSNILDLANFLVSQENIGLTTPLSHCIAASPVKDVWGQQSHTEKRINYRKS